MHTSNRCRREGQVNNEGAPTFSGNENESTTETAKATNTSRKEIMAPACGCMYGRIDFMRSLDMMDGGVNKLTYVRVPISD